MTLDGLKDIGHIESVECTREHVAWHAVLIQHAITYHVDQACRGYELIILGGKNP
jgi:hypothetical protein